MWKRLARKIRPYIDSLSTADTSEKILEQNLREMNEQVPGLDQNIALIKANITLLEKDLDKLIKDETSLLSRVRAAITAERDDLAVNFAATLEAVHTSKVNTIGQLATARAAYDKALEVKKIFIREKERNFQDAIQVVRANQRARWQKIVADALERFEAADIDSTHDEMIRKIEEQTALSESRLEMALASVDVEVIKLDEEAEAFQANELVKQLKKEMGKGK